jgi:hypothetical protein
MCARRARTGRLTPERRTHLRWFRRRVAVSASRDWWPRLVIDALDQTKDSTTRAGRHHIHPIVRNLAVDGAHSERKSSGQVARLRAMFKGVDGVYDAAKAAVAVSRTQPGRTLLTKCECERRQTPCGHCCVPHQSAGVAQLRMAYSHLEVPLTMRCSVTRDQNTTVGALK